MEFVWALDSIDSVAVSCDVERQLLLVLKMASLWRRRCIRKVNSGKDTRNEKESKEGAIKWARKLKFCFNWNHFETCRSSSCVSVQRVLHPLPTAATRTLLADGRTVICCTENWSLTFGNLCPEIISFQFLQQLTSVWYYFHFCVQNFMFIKWANYLHFFMSFLKYLFT